MSEIRAGTTTTTALQQTGDTSGNLVLTADSGRVQVNGTGVLQLPVGTTAQRPATPQNGDFRLNTTTQQTEIYYDGTWFVVSSLSYGVEFLLVAGGASGAGSTSGGGGAGGAIDGISLVTPATNYQIVIGAGGASVSQQTIGNNGSNSTGLTNTALGGGRGAGTSPNSTFAGSAGGSGGGGAGYTGGGGMVNSGNGYAGTTGQGNAGGNYGNESAMGGGGGAGTAGGNGSGTTGGSGGTGINWKSLGTFYAGGGGGGASATGGTGGAGGGGAGQASGGSVGNGSVNTGGGGGGGYNYTGGIGGGGGSGICIIRYLGNQRGIGGTITAANGYTYHTFTTSGTFTA